MVDNAYSYTQKGQNLLGAAHTGINQYSFSRLGATCEKRFHPSHTVLYNTELLPNEYPQQIWSGDASPSPVSVHAKFQ